MGIFDIAMIGKVSHLHIAGASFAHNVFMILAVFGMGLLMVIPALTSIMEGQPEGHNLSRFTRDGIWVSIMVSIVTFVAILIAIQYFDRFGQEPVVEELAKPYLRIVGYSVLPMFIFLLFKGISDGHSNTRPSMVITLVALGLNVLFNWLFIYGNWGFARMELNGAGWATFWSRMSMAIMMIGWVIYNKKIDLTLRSLITKSQGVQDYLRLILKKGIPSGFQFFFEVTAFALAGIFAGMIGAIEQASHQIAMNLAAVTYMFLGGLSTAAMIVIGEHHSTRNVLKIREYTKHVLLLGFAFTILFSLAFIALRFPLAELFNDKIEVITIAGQLLLFAAAFQMFDGIQVIHQGILRGMEDTFVPSLITMLAYWFVATPLCYIFGLVLGWNVNGIWLGLTIGLMISAGLLSLRVRSKLRLSRKNS